MTIDERNKTMQHNKAVWSKELKEHNAIEKEYKPKLKKDERAWNDYNKKVESRISREDASFVDKKKALGATAKYVGLSLKNIKYIKKPRVVLKEDGFHEDNSPLKDRAKLIIDDLKRTGLIYKDSKEGNKASRIYEESKDFLPKETKEYQHYKKKHLAITNKYKNLYKKYN